MSSRPTVGASPKKRRRFSPTVTLALISAFLMGISAYSVFSASISPFFHRQGLADERAKQEKGPEPPHSYADGASRAMALPRFLREAPSDWDTATLLQPLTPVQRAVPPPEDALPRPIQQPVRKVPMPKQAPIMQGNQPTASMAPLLIIGIPTVGRPSDADYLLRTLCYIEAQVTNPPCVQRCSTCPAHPFIHVIVCLGSRTNRHLGVRPLVGRLGPKSDGIGRHRALSHECPRCGHGQRPWEVSLAMKGGIRVPVANAAVAFLCIRAKTTFLIVWGFLCALHFAQASPHFRDGKGSMVPS